MSSAFVGHDHPPVPRTPADPFQAEQTVAKRRSECTGQMWPPLAPVETCEGVSATPLASAGDVDPKSREAVLSIVRDGERPVSRAEYALGDQREIAFHVAESANYAKAVGALPVAGEPSRLD